MDEHQKTQCATALRKRQQRGGKILGVPQKEGPKRDGGWGQHAASKPTLPSTAQVLASLRMLREPPESACIRNGLAYAIRTLKEKLAEDRPGIRYPHAAIMALTEFPAVRRESDVADALDLAQEWIADHVSDEGAWGWRPGEPPSVFATTQAITALDRLDPRRNLADPARDWLMSQALEAEPEGISWKQIDVDDFPSPSYTAHAVNALAEGSSEHRAAAESGARWLLRHPELWDQHLERDRHIRGVIWTHARFAACGLACINGGGRLPNITQRIRPLLRGLDGRWRDAEGGWTHQLGEPCGAPGIEAVLRIDEMLAARGEEWASLARGASPSPARTDLTARLDGQRLEFQDVSGTTVASLTFDKKADGPNLLRALADAEARRQPVDIADLARNTKAKPSSFLRTIRRNAKKIEQDIDGEYVGPLIEVFQGRVSLLMELEVAS